MRKIKVCIKCEDCNKYPTRQLKLVETINNKEICRQDKKYGEFHGCKNNNSLGVDCSLEIPKECEYKMDHEILNTNNSLE